MYIKKKSLIIALIHNLQCNKNVSKSFSATNMHIQLLGCHGLLQMWLKRETNVVNSLSKNDTRWHLLPTMWFLRKLSNTKTVMTSAYKNLQLFRAFPLLCQDNLLSTQVSKSNAFTEVAIKVTRKSKIIVLRSFGPLENNFNLLQQFMLIYFMLLKNCFEWLGCKAIKREYFFTSPSST